MQITIPENISDITLAQFLKYEDLRQRDLDPVTYNRRKVSIFTGVPFKDTINIRRVDFERLLSMIDAALTSDVEFKDRFTMHDIEFGFIPNFDKITLGEYADLSQYGAEPETLHKLMAILYRPIVNKQGDKYDIMPYNSTEEYAEMMRDTPLNCVNGALVFFWNLANDLQTATQKFLTAELLKEMPQPTTSRLSAGYQRLKDYVKMTFAGWMK